MSGSIPACAGEPLLPQAPAGQIIRVYPRVCGGTVCRCCRSRAGRTVYPRVCGGTLHATYARVIPDMGLSPRVRGNPLGTGHAEQDDGLLRVYPRVCGGTSYRPAMP